VAVTVVSLVMLGQTCPARQVVARDEGSIQTTAECFRLLIYSRNDSCAAIPHLGISVPGLPRDEP
jgi:hypothetical protein